MNPSRSEPTRLRLDDVLVSRGLYDSRSRARDAIERGTVTVDGRRILKPGQAVSAEASVEVDDPARRYVSRAALKLIAGLDHFSLNAAGCRALDIGASTGGFTQVLLERGAAHVTAIDVGHGQMYARLRADPRVTVIEGLNARDLTADYIPGGAPDFLVCDVSFISLTLALPPALELASRGAGGVFLVKPQFEAGREAIDKGGLLRNPADGLRTAEARRDWLDSFPGWRAIGLVPSPIVGGDGNHEFLLAGVKDR